LDYLLDFYVPFLHWNLPHFRWLVARFFFFLELLLDIRINLHSNPLYDVVDQYKLNFHRDGQYFGIQ